MLRFHHTAMAAQFDIRCAHPDERYARQAARMAFEAVDRLEQQLSRFVENSDISRINHLAAGEETKIGLETMECLRLARLVYDETGGACDPSIGTGFARLELIADAFAVRAGADGVQLDLGAIGKGYAVDRIAEVLEDWDVHEALVDAGYSSVLALEPPAGREDWPLTLSLPGEADGAVFARIGARQRALGASGIRKGDHIHDPRTGTPVRARQAAWVSGSRDVLCGISRRAGLRPSPAALADALSTAFMIVPAEQIDQYCQTHGIEAWILEGGVTHFPM
jgi:thiamine biosynthesis lipoprotein